MKVIRFWLYILSGITSALIGWFVSQLIITDLNFNPLNQMRELVVFPCIALFLAVGMVLNEIYISNPTRTSLCWKKAKTPLLWALGLGIVLGIAVGLIARFLFLPQFNFPTIFIRIIGWILIGFTVGIAEGLTWWLRSEEAGNKKRLQKRLITSITSAIIASLAAAILFELFRSIGDTNNSNFRIAEDIVGFSLLGLMLGLTFNFSNSPSYSTALRAGAGFEYKYKPETSRGLDSAKTLLNEPYPFIKESELQFIQDKSKLEHNGADNEIEEGLSIQLPGTGKIIIGSEQNGNAHISIPGLAVHVAFIEINRREAVLKPNPRAYRDIAVNGKRLTSKRIIPLKHNSIISFYSPSKEKPYHEKVYRFVYYNRFLDPQA